MTEFDPEEVVRFDNKDLSLLTVVREIMRQSPERRIGVMVLRDVGKKPPFLDGSDIENIAQLPAFKGQ
jgi:hypothetical protein